jgi:hypothetical protein
MGVRLVNLGDGQTLVAIARNAESAESDEDVVTDEDAGDSPVDEASDGAGDGAGEDGE